MPFDLEAPRTDPDVQRAFEGLKRQQDRLIADWRRPRGVCASGFDEVNPPMVRTDAELIAAAEQEATAHRAWREAPEQVADRDRLKAIAERDDALNRAFWGAVASQAEAA